MHRSSPGAHLQVRRGIYYHHGIYVSDAWVIQFGSGATLPHTGRAELRVAGNVILLQSPWQPSSWFEFRSRRVWRRRVDEHDVEIVKVRSMTPGGGTSPQSYTISVDNTVVAEATGM